MAIRLRAKGTFCDVTNLFIKKNYYLNTSCVFLQDLLPQIILEAQNKCFYCYSHLRNSRVCLVVTNFKK